MSSAFDTTQWTLILKAATSQTPDGMAALDALCRRYWKPLHAYACSRGCAPADAEDITQSFFQRLLANKTHMLADRSRGRFRTFLLAAMQNFMNNEHRDATRLKRGGPDARHLPLDDVAHELRATDTPETIYEKKWAQAVIAAAIERLRVEHASAGHMERFTVLRPLLATRHDGDTASLAAQLGVSVANFRKLLQNFRRNYGHHVRSEVALLVTDPAEVDDEIAHLMKALVT